MIHPHRCWFVLLLGGGLALSAVPSASAGTETTVRPVQTPPDTTSPVEYDLGVATGYDRITENRATERYLTLSLLPELYVGKVGIGLLARLHVQPGRGSIRDEDYNRAKDYLGLLYFVEYGQESDSAAYGRLGQLDEVSFGYGHFVDRYTNDVSLDDPMRGITGVISVGKIQVEGLFNELADPGVMGAHGAYFPLGLEPQSLPRVQVGLSIAADVDSEGSQINPAEPGAPFLRSASAAPGEPPLPVGIDDGALFMMGLDAGVRLFHTETVSVHSFVEGSKIVNYGIGASLGLRATTEVGPLEVNGRYVQLVLGPEFLPDYFDSTYEVQRLRSVDLATGSSENQSVINTKRNQLRARRTTGYGYQTRVSVDYEETFESTIGYQTILGETFGNEFTFDFRLHAADIPVSLRLGYDRFRIDRWSDIFVPSREDALYRIGAAYQILSPLRLGIEIRQTYEPTYQRGRKAGRTKQNHIEPFVQLRLRF